MAATFPTATDGERILPKGGSSTAGQLSTLEKSERHAKELALIESATAIVKMARRFSVCEFIPARAKDAEGTEKAKAELQKALDEMRPQFHPVGETKIDDGGFFDLYKRAVAFLASKFPG